MRGLGFHDAVPAEARAIFEYYRDISEKLGDAFWDELTGALEVARQYPTRHHFDVTGLRRAQLRRFPIHFLFRVFPTHIRVTAIRHDRRIPSFGSRRR